ncbi:hypothetical protein ACEPAI_1813 [Sanghuangporus weigelae]
MPIAPGIYFVENVMSGTSLDIFTEDDQRVVGSAHHGGESQQWEFGKLGAGWFIRNVNNKHYVTIEKGLGNALPTGENEYPAAWVLTGEPTRGTNIFWIRWPKTRYALNLSGGIPVNGTKVVLYLRDETIPLLARPGLSMATTTTITTVTTTTTRPILLETEHSSKA